MEKFYNATQVFVDLYGFLGFFREAFASPMLPARVAWPDSLVAPDALIERDGKLRFIDPATEGKRLLENLLDDRWEKGGELRPSSGRVTLERHRVAWPNELRFPTHGLDGGEFGLLQPMSEWRHSSARSYDEVRERFGIRFVLDEQADAGVSIIATREPLDFWRRVLEAFQPAPSEPAYFDGQTLEGVSPRAVADEDGDLASSWRCPSLLKAIYLMLYLDLTAGARLQKCQAPGCPEYYRVGPRSRESLYCPPSPGRKQSKCASRASSAMYRERQRRRS